MSSAHPTTRSLRGPRRLAVVTACATFCLLLIGGLVHNTRSSLACPDWPLCFGSAFPKMQGGVFYEHSHRLAATTVGLLTVALAISLSRHGRRLALLGWAAVALVVFQGILGGITVLYRLPTMVSTTHLATSLLFFSLMIYLAFRLREAPGSALVLPASLRRQIAIAGGAIYFQSLVGALMRHLGVGLACVDLPLCRGALWPSTEHPSVQLHAAHRLLAVIVGVLVTVVAMRVRAAAGEQRLVRLVATAMPLVVLAQIGLGVASILTFLDALPVTAHLGGAALLVAGQVSLYLLSATATTRAPVVATPDRATHAGLAA